MTTGALVMMIITWAYVLFMVVYFFTRLLRKERQKRKENAEIKQKTGK